MNTLFVIPARIGSTRLARKMLKNIGELPVIVHTYNSVKSADIGDVIVACDSTEIKEVIEQHGGTAIVTDPNLPSGTDRVFAAWQQFDAQEKYKYIVNVQGDVPFVSADFIKEVERIIKNEDVDVSTVAAIFAEGSDAYKSASVVKPVISFRHDNYGLALYFSRSPIPYGDSPYYEHVGIYGYKADVLKKFVTLPQSPLEKSEKLEQLRVLENGMKIGISVLQKIAPISIDTADDFHKACEQYKTFNR